MFEKYTSERLLRELPRSLLNFLWYIWETYSNPGETEFHITLDGDASGQKFIIHSTGETVTEAFGCHIDADIVIRKVGARFFMEYR